MLKFFSAIKSHFARKSHVVLLPLLALCSALAQADIYRSLDPETPNKFADELPKEGRWELYYKVKPAQIRQEPESDHRRFAVDGRTRYASQIRAAAMANKVDAALIRAVISVESGYNPSAVSRAGAVGLMQLMPATAKRYNVTDAHDPAQNIHGGTQYLRDLLRMFNNDLHLTLAAYNAGEQAVVRYRNRIPPYRETLEYVPKVMKFYKRYSGGNTAAGESGEQRFSTVPVNKGIQARVTRTYIVNPA